jgi:hypothetical protein
METFMLGNANCSENMNWTESVFLVVETIGFMDIDHNNDTWPEIGFDNVESELETMPSGPHDIVVTPPDHMPESPEDEDTETCEFESRWYHVYFTPKSFNVTLLNQTDFYYSNLTDFYYRNMTDLYYNNMTEGFCMPILDYWNNQTLGCPCNGTWNTTGYYNSTANAFMGGRKITPSQCSNDSCRDVFFLNDTIKYANIRINVTEHDNGTVLKTVEITRMSYDRDEGYTYGVQDVAHVYGVWDQKGVVEDKKGVVDLLAGENNTMPNLPEIAPISKDHENNDTNSGDVYGSNGIELPMSIVITMIFSFLLSMMIHSN